MYVNMRYIEMDKKPVKVGGLGVERVVEDSRFIGKLSSVTENMVYKLYGSGIVATHSIRVKNSSIIFKPGNIVVVGDNTHRVVRVDGTSFKQTLLVKSEAVDISESI